MDQAHFFVTGHRCARLLVHILPSNGDGNCRQNCREVAWSAQAASRRESVASITDARRVAYTRTVTADTVRARTGWLRCEKIVLVREDAKKTGGGSGSGSGSEARDAPCGGWSLYQLSTKNEPARKHRATGGGEGRRRRREARRVRTRS